MEYRQFLGRWYEVDYLMNWLCPEHGLWTEQLKVKPKTSFYNGLCPYRKYPTSFNPGINGICPHYITGQVVMFADALSPEHANALFLAGKLPVNEWWFEPTSYSPRTQ